MPFFSSHWPPPQSIILFVLLATGRQRQVVFQPFKSTFLDSFYDQQNERTNSALAACPSPMHVLHFVVLHELPSSRSKRSSKKALVPIVHSIRPCLVIWWVIITEVDAPYRALSSPTKATLWRAVLPFIGTQRRRRGGGGVAVCLGAERSKYVWSTRNTTTTVLEIN